LKARELRNLSLEEIAKFTKIKEDFLKAIEENRYELLPPAIYVKGFLTIYARYLGLNPYDVVHRYQKYLEDISISKKQKGLPQQIPIKKRESDRGSFLSPSLESFSISHFSYVIVDGLVRSQAASFIKIWLPKLSRPK